MCLMSISRKLRNMITIILFVSGALIMFCHCTSISNNTYKVCLNAVKFYLTGVHNQMNYDKIYLFYFIFASFTFVHFCSIRLLCFSLACFMNTYKICEKKHPNHAFYTWINVSLCWILSSVVFSRSIQVILNNVSKIAAISGQPY